MLLTSQHTLSPRQSFHLRSLFRPGTSRWWWRKRRTDYRSLLRDFCSRAPISISAFKVYSSVTKLFSVWNIKRLLQQRLEAFKLQGDFFSSSLWPFLEMLFLTFLSLKAESLKTFKQHCDTTVLKILFLKLGWHSLLFKSERSLKNIWTKSDSSSQNLFLVFSWNVGVLNWASVHSFVLFLFFF